MATYRTTFIVRGTGAFPFDMLRYDCCHPYTGSDVTSMLSLGIREVKLCRVHSNMDPCLTPDRWSASAWRIKPDSINTMMVG